MQKVICENTVYSKCSRIRDLIIEFASVNYWYLGWKARMAARAERKEPEPKSKIKVISVDEVPRGFIY